jgi:hypothetical protein
VLVVIWIVVSAQAEEKGPAAGAPGSCRYSLPERRLFSSRSQRTMADLGFLFSFTAAGHCFSSEIHRPDLLED